MSFEAGMKAAADAIEGISVRKDRRSQQRLRKAQGKVLREDAKEKKAERKAREKYGYYDTKKTQLTPEQSAEIEEARQTNPKLARELEETYLGPLRGQFIKKEKAAVKSEVAKAKSAKQEAIKQKLVNDRQKEINRLTTTDQYARIAEAKVQQEEAAPEKTKADAAYTMKQVEFYAEEARNRMDVARMNAESNRVTAHSNMLNATANLGELELKRNEYQDSKTLAENTVAQRGYIDESASQFLSVLASGPQEGEGPLAFTDRMWALLDNSTRYAGGIQANSDYQQLRRVELTKHLEDYLKRNRDEKDWQNSKKYEVISAIASDSLKRRGMQERVEQARQRDGQLGVEDLETRAYILYDAKQSGIPLNVLNEDNPESKSIWAYNVNPNRLYQTYLEDGQEKPVTDAEGNLQKTRLLDMDITLDQWEDYKRDWLQKNKPVNVQRRIEDSTQSGGSGGVISLDASQAGQPTSRKSDTTTFTGTNAAAITGTPVLPSEMEQLADPDQVFRFLNNMAKSPNPLVAPVSPAPSTATPSETVPEQEPMSDNTGRSLTPTDAGDTIGLRIDEITSNYYTDPQSTGGMIERGVTNLEKLRQQEEEVKRQTKGDNSEGAIAARKRAADRVSEAKEATEILEVRELTSKYIDEDDYYVDGDRVFLDIKIPDEIKNAASELSKSDFGVTLSASRSTPENLIKRRLYELTGSMSRYGRFEGLGLTKTVGHGYQNRVVKNYNQLKSDSQIKIPKDASAYNARILGDKRDKAIRKLKSMEQEEKKLAGYLEVMDKLENIKDGLGKNLSVQDARKYGIIK